MKNAAPLTEQTYWRLQKPLDIKSTEILDVSRFGDVALHDDHFRPRGANVPGVKTSWVLAGDLRGVLDLVGDTGTPDTITDVAFFTTAIFLPLIYGGVHLSAWNFEFPTSTEGLLWKISAFIIATSLLAWLILGGLLSEACDRFRWGIKVSDIVFGDILGSVLGRMLIYAMALSRAYIVVEAFISLRAVPIGVYWTPAWVQMIPHV
jgi:hypothetical protein